MTDKTLDRIADALEKLVDAYVQAQRRDHYAANEERQREEAEHDTLDEDDHRDRLDRDGERWTRIAPRWWVQKGVERSGPFSTPRGIDVLHGPITFAPDASPAPQDAAQGAAEGEGDAVEGGGAARPSEALLCHQCGHDIDSHRRFGCRWCLICELAPSGIARRLIAQATS